MSGLMLFGSPKRWRARRQPKRTAAGTQNTLAGAPAGSTVVVVGFEPGLPAERLAQLQAYGLTPGCLVQVIQQRPVTVVRFEHIELALEGGLANKVKVSAV